MITPADIALYLILGVVSVLLFADSIKIQVKEKAERVEDVDKIFIIALVCLMLLYPIFILIAIFNILYEIFFTKSE